MSKLEVKEIGPISGETDLKLGQSGGTVTLADGALPVGWEKAGFTAAYSVSSWVPDGVNSTPDYNNMPISKTSGTSADGTEFVVSQPPIGLDIIENGDARDNIIKISHPGVYVIYTAVQARTSGSSTSLKSIACSAIINGEKVRQGSSSYAPAGFSMFNNANNVVWCYGPCMNDTWIGLLNEGDEIQFFYDGLTSTGAIRIQGLVGSIIYVGDSD